MPLTVSVTMSPTFTSPPTVPVMVVNSCLASSAFRMLSPLMGSMVMLATTSAGGTISGFPSKSGNKSGAV